MQTSPKLALLFAALFLLGLAVVSPAVAQTTVYNFQLENPNGGNGYSGTTYTGIGVLAGSGNGTTSVFNALSQNGGDYNFTNVRDSNGVSSGVGLTVTSNGGFSGNQSANPTDPRALLGSFAVSNGVVGHITLTGLAPNASFTLAIFGINGGYNDRTTKFTLTDSTFTVPGSTMTTTAGQDITFNNPQNYVVLTGTTTTQGAVYATYAGANTPEADITGLQIAVGSQPSPVMTVARGVNMAGAEFGSALPGILGHDFTYNSEASFQYFGSKGLTLIRVPLLWERIQQTLNGPLDPTNLNALKQDIAWAKAHGDKVVIDIHDYGRCALNENGVYNSYVIDNVYGGVVKVSSANLANLWTRLSTEFKNEPGVYAYGLMNEPHDMGTASWQAISQTVLTAIRNNGDAKLIMVPGNGWASASGWAGNNGSTSWINDPANNFKYEAHEYFDSNSSGSYSQSYDQELAANPNLATVGQQRLAPFVNWCRSNAVSGFLGEYGVPNTDVRWLTVLDNFLSSLDAAKFDGTYWAAGEWWGNYPLSVQPTNNFTTDAAQMTILLKHAK